MSLVIEPADPRRQPSVEYIATLRDLGASDKTIALAQRQPRRRRWFKR